MDISIIPECSGIVKSRNYPDLYWVLSDSGNPPAVFPIHADGTIEGGDGGFLTDQANIDWEDITIDHRDNLILSDSGNNLLNRDNLAVILFPEPDPYQDSSADDIIRIDFRYPETKPEKIRSYDSEALFWYRGALYLLTKHLTGYSRLYRFPSLEPGREQTLTFILAFHPKGMVTAADADDSRNELAVLTYSGIHLFDLETVETGTEDYTLEDLVEISFLPLAAGQCEGVCFSGDSLIITNEMGGIFSVPLADLHR